MSSRLQPSLLLLLSGTAATASAAVAMFAHASLRADGSTAEGLFLAYFACCVLLGLLPGALEGGRVGVSWWVSLLVLVTLAHWVLPPGSPRGGAITVMLAMAAVGSLRNGFAAAVDSWQAPSAVLGLGWVVGAAVGLQTLLKPRSLLGLPGERSLLIWIVLAAIAAGLTLLLARRSGAAALVGLGAAALVGDGLTGTVVVSLAAIVWAAELAARRPGLRALIIGLLPLLLPLLWDPQRGGLALLAALALVLGRMWVPALFVGAGLLLLVGEGRPWIDVLPGLVALAITLPTLLLPGKLWQPQAVAAIALAAVGLRLLPPSQSLPAAAILASLLALRGASRERLSASAAWVALLLGWRCLRSGYPWLRDGDVVAAIEALDLPLGGWAAALGLALAVAVFALAAKGGPVRSLAIALAGAALMLPAAWRWIGRETLVEWPPVVLESARPTWSQPLPSRTRQASARLILDSSLAHSSELAAGRPVLVVRLHGLAEARSWKLSVGPDTGDWAADREGTAAPEPWTHWLDSSGTFFGQRYRSVLELGAIPPEGGELEIALLPGLPEPLEATLYRVVLVRDRSVR